MAKATMLALSQLKEPKEELAKRKLVLNETAKVKTGVGEE